LIEKIREEIKLLGQHPELLFEKNFLLRKRLLESISIFESANNSESQLTQELSALKLKVTERNESIVGYTLKKLRNSAEDPLKCKSILFQFLDREDNRFKESNLDLLIDEMFKVDIDSVRRPKRNLDYIHLERTPAIVVLEAIDHLGNMGEKILYDLGSGLGHVLFFFSLLTQCKVLV
jgi:hypothetical protein